MVIRAFTVPVRGTGKPDYAREVAKGTQILGYRLEYGESILWLCTMFVTSPGASIVTRGPLLPGETAYALDVLTGANFATIEAGYDYIIKEWWCTFTEDVYFETYQGGTMSDISCLATLPAGVSPINILEQGWTRSLCEDISVPSIIQCTVKNLGSQPAIGKLWVLGLQKLGAYEWL